MNRAERRRESREHCKANTTTYNLTKAQLDAVIREGVECRVNEIKENAAKEAIDTAMILMLGLPLKVLKDHYWTKTYQKKLPEFTDKVLEYYEKWEKGEIDINKLKEEIYAFSGVKILEEDTYCG